MENTCIRVTTIHGLEVEVVEGAGDIPNNVGAFLNFGTNIYNPTQIEKCPRAFTEGRVNDGDLLFPLMLGIRYY